MMKLQEKGTFEYLKRKKKQNLLIMLISFAVVFAVFFAGLAVFKSRNNYCTLIATVLVLPAAKFAVAYFVLLPHKSATQAQKEAVGSCCRSAYLLLRLRFFKQQKSDWYTGSCCHRQCRLRAHTGRKGG